jgi:hypothetical protein
VGIATSIATSVTDGAIAILGVAVVGLFFAVWHTSASSWQRSAMPRNGL